METRSLHVFVVLLLSLAGQRAVADGAVADGCACFNPPCCRGVKSARIDAVWYDLATGLPVTNSEPPWRSLYETGPTAVGENTAPISEEERMQLNVLYRQLLGRDADPVGLEGWLSSLRQPDGIRLVAKGITESEEYQQRRGYGGPP